MSYIIEVGIKYPDKIPGNLTDPKLPFVSLRSASQTVAASAKSPRNVANSASLRCCIDGSTLVLNEAIELEY